MHSEHRAVCEGDIMQTITFARRNPVFALNRCARDDNPENTATASEAMQMRRPPGEISHESAESVPYVFPDT
jgi:hypothetical protein